MTVEEKQVTLQMVTWIHMHGAFHVCYTATATSEKCAC